MVIGNTVRSTSPSYTASWLFCHLLASSWKEKHRRLKPSPPSKNYNLGEGNDVVAFRIPPQVDIPAQRPTRSEDLHTFPGANHAVGYVEEHPSVGKAVQQAVVLDKKPLEVMIQSNARLSVMIAIDFAG
jgi:hypothetical protein